MEHHNSNNVNRISILHDDNNGGKNGASNNQGIIYWNDFNAIINTLSIF